MHRKSQPPVAVSLAFLATPFLTALVVTASILFYAGGANAAPVPDSYTTSSCKPQITAYLKPDRMTLLRIAPVAVTDAENPAVVSFQLARPDGVPRTDTDGFPVWTLTIGTKSAAQASQIRSATRFGAWLAARGNGDTQLFIHDDTNPRNCITLQLGPTDPNRLPDVRFFIPYTM